MEANEIIRLIESACDELWDSIVENEKEADRLAKEASTKQEALHLYLDVSHKRGEINGMVKAISLIKTHDKISKA